MYLQVLRHNSLMRFHCTDVDSVLQVRAHSRVLRLVHAFKILYNDCLYLSLHNLNGSAPVSFTSLQDREGRRALADRIL